MTYHDSGLPNITGVFNLGGRASINPIYRNNAFGVSSWSGFSTFVGGDVGGGTLPINFNASKSNPIYGRSKTVQPSSVTMNFYIRAK